MSDANRTKAELVAELVDLREEVAEAEAREVQHRVAEEALRQSEAKYRDLFMNATEGVYQTSIEGRIISANPALVKMLGYETEAELQALDVVSDLCSDEETRVQFTSELDEAGEFREMELTLKRKDGRHITVLDSARAIRDDKGQLEGFWGVLTDITERRKTEDRLRQTQFAVDHAEDTYDELRRMHCDVPIMLGSGYCHSELRKQLKDKGFATVLQKPYRRDRLVSTVANVLSGEC